MSSEPNFQLAKFAIDFYVEQLSDDMTYEDAIEAQKTRSMIADLQDFKDWIDEH